MAIDGVFAGDTGSLLALLVGLFLSLFFPIFVLSSFFFAAAGPIIRTAWNAIEGPDATDDIEHDGEIPWDHHVNRLGSSDDPLARRHLWLGTHTHLDYPVLLDREVVGEHCYYVGDTGSGKTARGITPLVTQLIRQQAGAVVVIDLKGG